MLEDPANSRDEPRGVEPIQLLERHCQIRGPRHRGADLVRSASTGTPDKARRAAIAFRTAKKIRSGVAGLSNTIGPPEGKHHAATASRSASRTEIASISGGSPT